LTQLLIVLKLLLVARNIFNVIVKVFSCASLSLVWWMFTRIRFLWFSHVFLRLTGRKVFYFRFNI